MNEVFWKANEREMGEFFRNMTEEQAQVFFDQYIHLRDERITALNQRYWQTGGGNESDLDFSPESLVPLWAWAEKHIHMRNYTSAELNHIRSLPVPVQKFHQKPLSEDSLILINDLAYYMAEVMIRNLEGVHWKVCKTKEKRYIDRNQPVLGGFSAPGFTLGINPRERVKGLARKALDNEDGKESLIDAYEKYADLLATKLD